MATDMKTVKAIIYNNKSLKNIKNTNGDIIWGSQSDYPYRRLEYIDIPPASYLNLNQQCNNETGLKIEWNPNPTGQTSQQTSGNPWGAIYYNGSTYYRYHLTASSTGQLQAYFGSGTNYKNTGQTTITNTKTTYELNYKTYKDKKLYVDDTLIGTYTTASSRLTPSFFLGARRRNQNGTTSTEIYPRSIRVYFLELQISTGTSKCYPVQRKSDGAIGLLKVYNDGASVRFCTSETSTPCIAGPVVDEYYDGAS